MQRHFPPLRELRRICWGLRGLAAARSSEASLQEQVREQMSLAHRHLQDLQRILGRLAGMAEKVEQALELRAA